MKFLFKIGVLFLVLTSSQIAHAQIKLVKIKATGLTCSMCSNAIYKQLKTIANVEKIETDLDSNTFTVTLKNQNDATPLIFKEKVEKAGFFIGSLVITSNFDTLSKNPYVLLDKSANTSNLLQAKVLNKGFLTDKEFKKTAKLSTDNTGFLKNNDTQFLIKILN